MAFILTFLVGATITVQLGFDRNLKPIDPSHNFRELQDVRGKPLSGNFSYVGQTLYFHENRIGATGEMTASIPLGHLSESVYSLHENDPAIMGRDFILDEEHFSLEIDARVGSQTYGKAIVREKVDGTLELFREAHNFYKDIINNIHLTTPQLQDLVGTKFYLRKDLGIETRGKLPFSPSYFPFTEFTVVRVFEFGGYWYVKGTTNRKISDFTPQGFHYQPLLFKVVIFNPKIMGKGVIALHSTDAFDINSFPFWRAQELQTNPFKIEYPDTLLMTAIKSRLPFWPRLQRATFCTSTVQLLYGKK